MQAPLSMQRFADQERAAIEAGRRSPQGFTVRRSQMLLASAQGQSTTTIARHFGCNAHAMRNELLTRCEQS